MAGATAGALLVLGLTPLTATPAQGVVAPEGQGFTVTAGDLSFILKQIKIAERHSETLTAANPCGTLVGSGVDQIPDRLTSYGLRSVDGSCNNLFAGRETFAAADVPFPRLTTPSFRDAEPITSSFPVGPPGPTSYKQKLAGNVVVDSQPRVVSNLVVDQTSTNPAAVAAAGFPVRTQGNPGKFPCTTDPDPSTGLGGVPEGCVPTGQTLFIPNVTTDVGLSPPFSAMFTFFGQFFDHGVDQTVKSGGTVFVPLKADDPLITLGPDHKANTGDEVTDPRQQFMVLTRGQNQPGPDGVLGTSDDIQDANNTDSPWVDQSQTYTSHSSHQVFLRDYDMTPGPDGVLGNTDDRPVSNGKLLGGEAKDAIYPGSPDGRTGMATWHSLKRQAATKLGLLLQDKDVTDIPMLAADPYGEFIPGPHGLPQYVTKTGLVEGNLAAPVAVPGNVLHFDTPFLTDIAHNADPTPVDTDHNPATPPVAPTPDTTAQDGGVDRPSADFAKQPAGTYDDEMLDAHFAAGDGRVNENIALTTIHQIFHSEHDRLVDDITNTLNANPTLKAAYQAAHPFGTKADIGFGYGARLFQAARFVTEMEYQHLVFEEFARKMVPAIRPFHVYSPDINPAIDAEFAHAVYRFGHSMLDDDVARTSTKADGTKVDNSLPLLNAFLNPPEYFDNKVDPAHPVYTPEEAAGAIVMGSSDQDGNEIDEFVTETLRNNLLGLPLDLPTINMARARSEGIPRLNEVRRQIFAQTNDGQLTPYTDWSDFGQHLKHPESLVNFVAAYGRHPSITSATTVAGKRVAARKIVDPRPAGPGPDGVFGTADDVAADVPPDDAADFMFSTGTWAGKETGLNDVDLWVGGLAEVTNLFGSLLGSTFNYVFQTQLEKLQDGDRFYYLARTPGMNLRTQLEGNSFSEMIQRNTDGTNTLKADAFATADCKFQLGNLTSPATLANPDGVAGTGDENLLLGAGTVTNDPTTECDENGLLVKFPDGTISYRQRNAIDPPGINGQSVYNGTPAVDRVRGGNDNDTFWGGLGNDVIDGQGGDDVALGGQGNDIISDLDGADTPKGGPGNDALDGGPGDDLPMGGDGKDFMNGGANDNESFAGPGDDFIIAGQGADAVFGDGGDDWIEGGSGQDLLQGDHGAPFFDDPAEAAPGNDVFIGQVGENDYDAEGGDDIMSQNAAIDRNAGAAGFDWAIHQYDTVGADDDMKINQMLLGVPIQVVVNRDRWQETEADSGSAYNDVMRGDDLERVVGGAGFSGCDALDPTGVARIRNLNKLVTRFPSPLQPIIDASISGQCPLDGAGKTAANPAGNVWAEGNILLGGGGSDLIEGRGNNDIIDGDHALTVRISVRTNPNDPATEIGSTDLMENQAKSGSFGAGTAGMTLQQAVFAGKVDPGNLVTVREITMGDTPDTVTAGDCGSASPVNCDTALYSAPPDAYTITANPDGSVTVADNAFVAAGDLFAKGDGVDTLWNIENLRFCTGNDPVTGNCNAFTNLSISAPAAPTNVTASSTTPSTATVSWSAPPDNGGPAVTSYEVAVKRASDGTVVRTLTGIPASARSQEITGLTNGTAYTFAVRAVNRFGPGPYSADSNAVTPVAVVPGAPVIGTATRGASGGAITAIANWTPPSFDGGSPITGYRVKALRMSSALATATVVNTTVSAVQPASARRLEMTLPAGNYRFVVFAINAVGAGPDSARSNNVVPR